MILISVFNPVGKPTTTPSLLMFWYSDISVLTIRSFPPMFLVLLYLVFFGFIIKLIFGGLLGSPETKSTLTQAYDGTSWFSRPSMATARIQLSSASAGTSALTLGAGGNIQNPVTNATEEFTGETTALNLKTITDSWFMVLISYKRKED